MNAAAFRNHVQSAIAELNMTEADYARNVLETIDPREKSYALADVTYVDANTVEFYFAGFTVTLRNSADGWMSDPLPLVTFDKNGLARTQADKNQEKHYRDLSLALDSATKRMRTGLYRLVTERNNDYSTVTRVSAAEAQALKSAAEAAQAERDAEAQARAEAEAANAALLARIAELEKQSAKQKSA